MEIAAAHRERRFVARLTASPGRTSGPFQIPERPEQIGGLVHPLVLPLLRPATFLNIVHNRPSLLQGIDQNLLPVTSTPLSLLQPAGDALEEGNNPTSLMT